MTVNEVALLKGIDESDLIAAYYEPNHCCVTLGGYETQLLVVNQYVVEPYYDYDYDDEITENIVKVDDDTDYNILEENLDKLVRIDIKETGEKDFIGFLRCYDGIGSDDMAWYNKKDLNFDPCGYISNNTCSYDYVEPICDENGECIDVDF